jgi:hypothetical protein
MPAYVLFIRESGIRDQSEMDIYQRMTRADYRAFIVEGL